MAASASLGSGAGAIGHPWRRRRPRAPAIFDLWHPWWPWDPHRRRRPRALELVTAAGLLRLAHLPPSTSPWWILNCQDFHLEVSCHHRVLQPGLHHSLHLLFHVLVERSRKLSSSTCAAGELSSGSRRPSQPEWPCWRRWANCSTNWESLDTARCWAQWRGPLPGAGLTRSYLQCWRAQAGVARLDACNRSGGLAGGGGGGGWT